MINPAADLSTDQLLDALTARGWRIDAPRRHNPCRVTDRGPDRGPWCTTHGEDHTPATHTRPVLLGPETVTRP